jgi:hypothetical protein
LRLISSPSLALNHKSSTLIRKHRNLWTSLILEHVPATRLSPLWPALWHATR